MLKHCCLFPFVFNNVLNMKMFHWGGIFKNLGSERPSNNEPQSGISAIWRVRSGRAPALLFAMILLNYFRVYIF